ncbi:MAG: tetratricopeptide repeat protein [Planctomycetia bacterium]|nr:tetratricopeptide repeat protein [Planctomycetia bacterium]
MKAQDQLEEAIAEFRRAIEIDRNDAVAHNNLGYTLLDLQRFDEALAEFGAAIKIDPDNALAHNNLGNALSDLKRFDEAIAEYRRAIEIDPNLAPAHYNLAHTLWDLGRVEKAMAEYRRAVEVEPGSALAHYNLGLALLELKEFDEAILEFRRAIEIAPDSAKAHNNLGNALAAKSRLDDAIAEYRRAIEIDPKHALAYRNLGLTLWEKGELSQAKENLQRAFDLLQPADPYRENCSARLKEVERLIPLEAKLADLLAGKAQPADNQERLGFAEVCRVQRRFAFAARLYSEALAEDAELAKDRNVPHRYNAACFAILAGSGQGVDAGSLGEENRAKLRRQAFDWLRGELAELAKALDGEKPDDRAFVLETLQHWQIDVDLAGARELDQIQKLPADEQGGWEKLWQDVEALRERSERHR